MEKIYMLQSGFVSKNTGKLGRSQEPDKTLNQRLIGISSSADYVNFFDSDIEVLFQDFRKSPSIAEDFDYREKVIKAFFRVFSGENISFSAWLGIQDAKEPLPLLHKKLIIDTIDYIYAGKPREIELFTYYRLLSDSGRSEVRNFAKGGGELYKSVEKMLAVGTSTDIAEIAKQWNRDLNTFCDMLVTMHVIFGKRS